MTMTMMTMSSQGWWWQSCVGGAGCAVCVVEAVAGEGYERHDFMAWKKKLTWWWSPMMKVKVMMMMMVTDIMIVMAGNEGSKGNIYNCSTSVEKWHHQSQASISCPHHSTSPCWVVELVDGGWWPTFVQRSPISPSIEPGHPSSHSDHWPPRQWYKYKTCVQRLLDDGID